MRDERFVTHPGKTAEGKTVRSSVLEARPKLLDQLQEAVRVRHYSRRTEQTYCVWVKRFIFFHHVRHPAEMAEPEINAFLTHLTVKERVSASTQTQALSALLFVYRHVLGREIGDLGEVIRARKPKRLPVVMTREEAKAVPSRLKGVTEIVMSPNSDAFSGTLSQVFLKPSKTPGSLSPAVQLANFYRFLPKSVLASCADQTPRRGFYLETISSIVMHTGRSVCLNLSGGQPLLIRKI
jgi:integrase